MQEVFKSSFNKAIKSFKLNALAKGKVEGYYHILDLIPTPLSSHHTIMEDDELETKASDKEETVLPYFHMKSNNNIPNQLLHFFVIYIFWYFLSSCTIFN